VTPDDGLYNNEVFSIQNVKLRTEDFDVVEDEIDLGIINYQGGSIGPGIITIENFFNDTDVDGDNGRDQNGQILPIRTSGPVNNLRVGVLPLQGPDLSNIPASGVQVLGIPRQVEQGEQASGRVSVDVPVDMPEGQYTGQVTIWEDNNRNGLVDALEPSDQITVTVTVQDREDVGVIEPEDAFIDDASIDAAAPDDLDSAILDGAVEDVSVPQDAEQPTPDIHIVDMGIENADSMSAEIDMTVADDAGSDDARVAPQDASPSNDLSAPDVSITALDASARTDADTETTSWPGLPRGGALGCQLQSMPSHSLLMVVLLMIFRRRR